MEGIPRMTRGSIQLNERTRSSLTLNEINESPRIVLNLYVQGILQFQMNALELPGLQR